MMSSQHEVCTERPPQRAHTPSPEQRSVPRTPKVEVFQPQLCGTYIRTREMTIFIQSRLWPWVWPSAIEFRVSVDAINVCVARVPMFIRLLAKYPHNVFRSTDVWSGASSEIVILEDLVCQGAHDNDDCARTGAIQASRCVQRSMVGAGMIDSLQASHRASKHGRDTCLQ